MSPGLSALPLISYRLQGCLLPAFYILLQYFDSMKWNDQMSVLCNEGVRNHGAINVKTEDFFAIRIPLPCMEEQQKIGSFLAEIDKEIQIQKEFIKTYAEGKRRMMRDLIEG